MVISAQDIRARSAVEYSRIKAGLKMDVIPAVPFGADHLCVFLQ